MTDVEGNTSSVSIADVEAATGNAIVKYATEEVMIWRHWPGGYWVGAITIASAVVTVLFIFYQYYAINVYDKDRTRAFLQVFLLHFIGGGVTNIVYGKFFFPAFVSAFCSLFF